MPSFSSIVNNPAMPGLLLIESESVAVAGGWKEARSSAGTVTWPAVAGTWQSTALELTYHRDGICESNCTYTRSAPE